MAAENMVLADAEYTMSNLMAYMPVLLK